MQLVRVFDETTRFRPNQALRSKNRRVPPSRDGRGDRGAGGKQGAVETPLTLTLSPLRGERGQDLRRNGGGDAPLRGASAPTRATREWESADKPGSVLDSHSSGMRVAAHLTRPTREPCGPHYAPLFGLAPGGVYPATGVTTGAVRSYRTISPLPRRCRRGGIFSVALSVGSRPPGVTWHPALWSPDFPPCRRQRRGTATVWPTPGIESRAWGSSDQDARYSSSSPAGPAASERPERPIACR